MITHTYGLGVSYGIVDPTGTPAAGANILYQNQTNATLWWWDTTLWKQLGPVSIGNALTGSGTVSDPFKVGGTLVENLALDGAAAYHAQLTNVRSFIVSVNNGASASRSSFSLTTPLSSGSFLKSELYTDPTIYGQVVVDSDGPGTEIGQYNGSNFSRLKFLSASAADFEILNGSTSYAYKLSTSGYTMPNVPEASADHVLAYNATTGVVSSLPHSSHIAGTPSVSAGAGAGTSPTISVVGTDERPTVTLTTGSTPSMGAAFTITFDNAFANSDVSVVFSPMNMASAAVMLYVSSVSSTSVTLNFGGTPVGATVYKFAFSINV